MAQVAEITHADVQSTRRTIATFSTYVEAQRTVDYLSDKKFPVERVTIVAEGLKVVEQVTGRLHWGKAAFNGAVAGAGTGLFLGFLFGLFSFITPLVSVFALALYGLIFGLLIGAVIGLVFYAFSGGQRDFTSVSAMQADQYTVTVDAEVADEATRLLAGLQHTTVH